MKSFYDICDRLIESGAAKDLSIGTTTNCTIYDKRIERIIENFKHVHLGLSIDAVTDLNDYIRYPSKIDSVLDYADKFLALRGDKLQISMRITPTIFSIWHIDKLFEYLLEHRVIAESCNILQDPNCLRIELLPKNLRKQVIGKIESVIKKHNLIRTVKEINVRREDNVDAAITNVIFEYLDFLKKVEIFPITADNERDKLIKFIRAYETLRNNKITDYLPEYEEFLRSHNY
jgi:sulfatase maturation enzyme AslB (radical SAM superfamily)